jgi:hypothetical protein
MANTGIDFNSEKIGLSTPKVRLQSHTAQSIEYVDLNSNSVGGTLKLIEYPEVVAMDLTQEQIEKGVYVEMVHYKRGRCASRFKNEDSSYKIPVSWIGGVNLFQGSSTRGGAHYSAAPNALLGVDRPNHYKVNAINEVIPVWRYLHNRLHKSTVDYIDTLGNFNSTSIFTHDNQFKKFGRSFMYGANYTPYYFAFRYVMQNDDGTFTTGALSRVLKLCTDQFAFIVDGKQSAILGRQVGSVHPFFNNDVFRVGWETRLP